MKGCFYPAVLLALAVGMSTARAAADPAAETEAEATFESLYGEEVTRALRTPSTADDAKLAGKLLDAAGTSRNQLELLALICEKAYDLGKKNSAGYEVAIEAMNVLSASSPDKKPQCLDRVVSIHQLRYARSSRDERPVIAQALINAMIDACDANAQAGNIAAAKLQCLKASRFAVTARLGQKEALQARYKELVAVERMAKRVAGYEARLKVDPLQIAAREALIDIYLIEKNDPAGAAKWLNEDCDERLRTYIPMAAGDINAIAEPTLAEMGEWYKSLAAAAQLADKGGLLLRAQTFYEAFIDKHTTADLAKTKAILALTRVRDDIKKYGVKVPAKIKTPAAAQFTGVSRKAAVNNPPRIPGLKAWTIELRAYRGQLHDVEFSKDSGQLITAGQDGAIRFWDVETGKSLRVLMGHDSDVRSLAWSADRKTLASGSSDKTIRLWDPMAGKVTKILKGSTASVAHLTWSPDSLGLASCGDRSNSVQIWSVRTGKIAGSLRATDYVHTIAWGAEGGLLATGSGDGNVSLWNVRTGKPYGHYPLDQYKSGTKLRAHGVQALAWSPVDPKMLAVGFSPGTIKLWKTRTRIFTKTMKPERKGRYTQIGHPGCIEWSPNGRTVAVGDSDGIVRFWNAATGSKTRQVAEHADSVSDIAWSPDGKFVATAGSDATSCLINAETGEVARKIQPTETRGSARPDFSADGKLMAYACRDKTIRIWDIEKFKQVSVITVPSTIEYVTVIKWSPDASKIAFLAYSSSAVRILDVKSGVVTASLAGKNDRLNDVIWSADSSKVYVSQSARDGFPSGKIQMWDVATSKVIFSLSLDKVSNYYKLAITADNKILASSSSGGKVYLWTLADRKLIRTIPAEEEALRCITFSPDGERLATCGRGKIVKVWSVSVSTSEPVFGLQKHTSEVYRVDFSPDGTKLVSAGMNSYVGVWELITGKNIAWFRGPNRQIRWMKDSKTIAAASGSGVYFYNAADGARKGSYLPMPKGQGVLISSGGHYAGPAGVEKSLIYQAVTLSGQSTLTQEEFEKRFGWKNDPSKIKLIEPSDKSSP